MIEVHFTVDSSATTGPTSIAVDDSAIPLGYSTDFGALSLDLPSATNGTLEIDADAPTIDVASIASNNAYDITLATVGDVITLSFTTSEAPALTPVVSIVEGGAGAVNVSGSGTSYTATKTVAAGGDGVVYLLYKH